MKEIWTKRGFEGVTALLSGGGVADVVGRFLALSINGANARADFLRHCLSVTSGLEREIDGCIQGFLQSVDGGGAHGAILPVVAASTDIGRTVRLFRCAPFGQNTWRLLDSYGKEIRDRYWQEVFPFWNRHSEAELIEIIDRLLTAKRPRAAFHAVHFAWPRIETSRLKRLLLDVATVDAEPAEHYKLEAYQISEALNSLENRNGVSPDEMAQLEFLYIKALDHSEHGIRNLEQQIAESPAIFVRVLALCVQAPRPWARPAGIADRRPRATCRSGLRRAQTSRSNQAPSGHPSRWQDRYRSTIRLGDRSAAALRQARPYRDR